MTNSAVEQTKEQELIAFKEQLVKAEGTLIPLTGYHSLLQEQLFIAARYGTSLNPRIHDGSILLIDLYSSLLDKTLPIGKRDFKIDKKQIAHSDVFGARELLNSQNPDNYEADIEYMEHLPIHIDNMDYRTTLFAHGGISSWKQAEGLGKQYLDQLAYREKKLGSLMMAVGVLILNNRHVFQIQTSSLIHEGIEKIYKKMGGINLDDGQIRIDTPVATDFVNQTLQMFI